MRVKAEYRIDDHTQVYQTNCLYTEDGQIVVVRDLPGEGTYFYDWCRGVYGLIPHRHDLSCESVEQHYLHNRYENDYRGELNRELGQLAFENKSKVPCTR